MKLPMIPFDKSNHLIYGLAIFISTSWALMVLNFLIFVPELTFNWLPLINVCLFAVGKEFYDNKFSKWDVFATIIGALILKIYLITL